MKPKTFFLLLLSFLMINSLIAQDVTTVEAADSDISENLDLEAIASMFGEAENLEDFEKKINDPDTKISNLDLNEDGEVDYLRVVETSKGETHLVTIQAVIGKDQYQDVATIDVEKDSEGETQVQVVGDVYMYGPDYIIEPVYVHPPVIYVFFWGPMYHPWRSPYYWGYYPPYYSPWRPYPAPRYRTNVNVHVNVNNSYKHTTVRRSKTSFELQNKSRRNDFGSKNPDKSYTNRKNSAVNKPDVQPKKSPDKTTKQKTDDVKKSTGKKVDDNWKPESERTGDKSKVKDNKVSEPNRKTNDVKKKSAPDVKSKSAPANKPSVQPRTKPKSKPAGKPKRK
jgi:hypothetical protein